MFKNYSYVTLLIITNFLAVVYYFAQREGMVTEVMSVDHFHIIKLMSVIVLFGIYLSLSSVYYGRTKNTASHVYFLASTMLNLGLAGTVFGFISMLHTAFGEKSITPETMTQVIPLIGSNWASALYATAVGVCGAIVLQVYAYIVEMDK